MVVFFPACSCSEEPDNNNEALNSKTTYTVHFYTGTQDTFNIPTQTVEHGGRVQQPDDPIRSGYAFVSWYKDMECTIAWNFQIDVVISDMTLYARWQKRSY